MARLFRRNLPVEHCQTPASCKPCGMAKLLWGGVMGIVLAKLLIGGFSWGQPLYLAAKPLQGGVQQSAIVQQRGIVGLDLTIRPNSYPQVAQVFAGTPAEKAGFKAGMVVLAVDGRSLLGLSRAVVDAAISDVPGQRVQFLVDAGEAQQPRVLMLTVAYLSELSPDTQRLFGN